jgi:hypothetical protein
MSRWYRAYEGTVSDPKLHEVALVAEVKRSVAIAVWHTLLESCASEQAGQFTIPPRRIAIILDETTATIEKVLAALEEVGLIKKTSVVHWSDRQFIADTSTERVRKFREKKKAAAESDAQNADNLDETFQKRFRNAPYTETETYTETDTEHTKSAREAEIDFPDRPDLTPRGFVELRNAFQSKTPIWSNPAKEIAALHRLCEIADHPTAPPDSLHKAVEKFWVLVSGQDKFWNKHPFLPSRLLALWDDVQRYTVKIEFDADWLADEALAGSSARGVK